MSKKVFNVLALVLCLGGAISALPARATEEVLTLKSTGQNDWVNNIIAPNLLSINEATCDFDKTYIRADKQYQYDEYDADLPVGALNKTVDNIRLVACAASWRGFGLPVMQLSVRGGDVNWPVNLVVGSPNYISYNINFPRDFVVTTTLNALKIRVVYMSDFATGIKLSNLKAIVSYR